MTGPTGRHFKPFDHRKMNPMAEIQEDSTWIPGTAAVENPYGEIMYAQVGPQPQPPPPVNTTLVIHKNLNLPHMPSELRHTNYSNNVVVGVGANRKPVNPQILDHHRDSANFSMASSDSG